MKTFLGIMALALFFAMVACSKDKFQSKPRLEIKDYSAKDVLNGDELTIRLNYYDKEGDLGLAPITGAINRLNILPLPPGQDKVDTIRYNLPEFPDKNFGEISFRLEYNSLKESLTENDTLTFSFYVQDRAGNMSDTITTDKIVIHL